MNVISSKRFWDAAQKHPDSKQQLALYERVLARIEEIMDAQPGTPEGGIGTTFLIDWKI